MKKTIILLLALLLCLAVPVSAAVDTDPPSVVDKSGLLTESEAALLEGELDAIGAEHGVDLVVLTVDSLDGQTAMAYADDYYDYNGYGDNGVLLLVSMGEREWWISTAGSCIWDVDSDDVSDDFLPYLSAGNYYAAFSAFGNSCDRALEWAANSGNQPAYPGYDDPVTYPDYDYDYDYDTPGVDAGSIITCVFIAAVIGLVIVGIMASGMKTVRSQHNAASYVRAGSLQVRISTDRFLYQNTTRTPRPQNNSSSGGRSGGGGGSVHRSSSGRSHGGGGGRF